MTPSSSISWEYLPLQSIEITPGVAAPRIRLTCTEEEGGPQFQVHCDEMAVDALAPYADLLRAWREDPYGTETPVIPVHCASGRYYFSVQGAFYDYPELERPFGWDNFTRHYVLLRRLVGQLQKAAKSKRLTGPDHALAQFIKMAT